MQNITKASTESESSNGLVILPYIKGTTEQNEFYASINLRLQ